jgi:hypothetical protein
MTLLNVANVSWVALLAAMAGTASTACSNNAGPAAKAFVQGEINAGTQAGVDDGAACGMNAGITWQLGSPISGQPTEYADGSNQGGGAVHVSCSVDQEGSNFAVHLYAELDGQSAGTLEVSGTVSSSGTGSGLSGSFSTAGQVFQDNNCTFSLTYNGTPLAAMYGPAPGRVWGHIDCPTAEELGQTGIGASGGQITRTCEASADFRFENCD